MDYVVITRKYLRSYSQTFFQISVREIQSPGQTIGPRLAPDDGRGPVLNSAPS